MSRDSAVSTATGYGLDGRGVSVRVPVGTRFFFPPPRSDRLWGPSSRLSNGYRGLSWPVTSNYCRGQYVDLYIHSPIRLHGVVLNHLSTGTTSSFRLTGWHPVTRSSWISPQWSNAKVSMDGNTHRGLLIGYRLGRCQAEVTQARGLAAAPRCILSPQLSNAIRGSRCPHIASKENSQLMSMCVLSFCTPAVAALN
jgi:hypothetical protein